MSEPTFAEDIEEEANGEPILACVITGQDAFFRSYRDEPDDKRAIDPALIGKPLTWAEARPLLNYEYDDGYGWQDCHDVNVFTESRVLFIHEYDGSTSVISVPRNLPEVPA